MASKVKNEIRILFRIYLFKIKSSCCYKSENQKDCGYASLWFIKKGYSFTVSLNTRLSATAWNSIPLTFALTIVASAC